MAETHHCMLEKGMGKIHCMPFSFFVAKFHFQAEVETKFLDSKNASPLW
jgi:hypothetical protein